MATLPDIGESLYNLLVADTGITDLVSTRIYQLKAPTTTTSPYVLFYKADGGIPNLVPRQQVDFMYRVEAVQVVQGDGAPTTAKAIQEALFTALHDVTLTVTDWTNYLCWVTGTYEIVETENKVDWWQMGVEINIRASKDDAVVESESYLPSDTVGLQLALDYRSGLYQSEGGAAASVANDLVGYWQDLSGQGNHYSQTTTADKGTLKDDGGVLVVEFDGISDFLQTLSLLSAGGTSARTLFMLAKSVTTPSSTEYLFSLNRDSSGEGNGRIWLLTAELGLRTFTFIEVYDTALSLSSYDVATLRNPASANVTDAQAWLNGTELGVSSSSAGAINVLGTKSALAKQSGIYGNFRVKTVWFYNVEKSDVERAAIEAEMALIP